MNILVADDDDITRLTVGSALGQWGYTVIDVSNGALAWAELQKLDGPRIAMLDWQMPGMDGPDICRHVRATPHLASVYLILLTGRDSQADVNEGLTAGADDYIAKPFNFDELQLRVRTGARIRQLQDDLSRRVSELENALAQVRLLQGILPICSYCKKIRDDANYWQQVESYIATHAEVRFSHGICPDCYESQVKPQLRKMNRDTPPYPQEP